MILCAGEALIDMLPRQSTASEDCFAPHAGGAVFNTSIALGRLGVPTQFFTGLSTDLFGAILEDALVASHVDASIAHRSDRPTTLAFVKLVDGQASYAFYDEGTAGRMLKLTARDLPPVTADAIFFGGISLAVEPCAETYATFMAREAPHRVTMLDPNVRPSFIRDELTYRGRIFEMFRSADIVKMSDEDILWFLPGASPAQSARRLLEEFDVQLVCLTEGSKGVTGYTATAEIFVPAEKAQVVDTVGAGDTFNAGLLASLHRANVLQKDRIAALPDDTLRAALALGAKTAAITVSRAGANPPWSHEL